MCFTAIVFFILLSAVVALQKQITELETELTELKNTQTMNVAYLESRIDQESIKK